MRKIIQMTNKIPCIDCICFPICKTQISNPDATYTSLMMMLYPKCCLLKQHVKSTFHSTFVYNPSRVCRVVNYFNLGVTNDSSLYVRGSKNEL